jgi:class 3 adenylate cyclase
MIIRYRSFLYEKEKQLLEREIAEKTEEVVRQKEKAEMLIKKLLPDDTAKEIQTAGRAKRKKYEMVTVLFSDIQGFTKIAEHMQSETLLDELDRLFLKFDELVERQRVEKIKTIGDAYMCAGGIPRKNRTNAIDVVMVAIEMREFMYDLKKEALNDWEIRIGIHTGPVIAGVIGNKKLSYDIWGDTVNIASRMESSGIPGEINISEATYSSISEFFDCEHRGKLPVKYKGEIDMYFVKGIKKEFSVNGEGKIPNDKFKLRYQQIRFRELEDVVYYKLENALNEDIKYHDLKHTIDVVNQVEVIGNGENVTPEEMIILKTAALLHDLGFVLGYNDHEESGVKLAKELLPEYGYTEDQIKTITELIYATKFPPNPENKLEEIICDADLDYLGRPDFLPVSIKLYEELFKFKQIKDTKDWNKLQVKFLESHQYYTKTAREMREVNKKIQLEKIKQWLKENDIQST